MQTKSYKEFAQIYDLLMTDIDYSKWTSFIMDKLGRKTKKILEAACGTGSITCILCENNYHVTAFDLSEDMLMIAYDKLNRNPNAKILNQDMTNFEIDDKFDAAICCCDGLNYLNHEDVGEYFKRVINHISESGKFIFDISTAYKYENMYNDSTYVYDDENVFYVWENTLDDEQGVVNMEINFFVNNQDNKYERITEEQTQYIHTVDEIKELLASTGFTNIEVYDDYTTRKFNNISQRAVFCCQK